MSIESITTRIQDEAKAYADEIMKSARAQADGLLDEARSEANRIKEEFEAAAKKDSKLLIERRESVAGLEARKMQLGAKQEIIKESFDRAVEKILSMGEDEYFTFLTSQLAAFTEGVILLGKDDLKKYGAKLAKEFAGKLTVAEEPIGIKGGFLLKQGDISINASIEKLIEDQKEKLTGEVAKLLFPQK